MNIIFRRFGLAIVLTFLVAWIIHGFIVPYKVARRTKKKYRPGFLSYPDSKSLNPVEIRLERISKQFLLATCLEFIVLAIIGFFNEWLK